MAKYDPLRFFLARQTGSRVRLTFAGIEDILRDSLPTSAHKYREWWANETRGSHVHAHAWMAAGWKVDDVDLAAKVATFVRS